MSKRIKVIAGIIFLIIGLILLSIVGSWFFAAIKYGSFNAGNFLLNYSWHLILGAIYLIFSILTFLDKKWIRYPSIIFSFLFVIFGIHSIISGVGTFGNYNEEYDFLLKHGLINWVLFITLLLLGIIFSWLNKADNN